MMDRLLAEMKGNVLDEAGRTPPANRARIDRVVGAVVAAVLLLGVGSAGAAFAFGLIPATPDSDPAPVSDSAPTESVPAASEPPTRSFPVVTTPPDPGPIPRIGSTCDDVIDTSGILAFMGDAGTPVVGPVGQFADPSSPYRSEADRAAAEQLGALTCIWSNGIEPNLDSAGRQEFVITVLPEGLDDAARYVEEYMIADPTYGPNVQGPRCVAESGYCELFGIIGSTWVELHAEGIVSAGMSDEQLRSSFREIIDPLVEHLNTVSIVDRWVPASVSPSASSDCATLAPTESIAPLTGVPDLTVGEWWDGPRIGQYSYAKAEVGAHRCSLMLPMSDATLGSIGILPNGAWAVERYSDDWSTVGGEEVALQPATGGTALLRCGDASAVCRVDFTVGNDWVSIIVPPFRSDGYLGQGSFETTRSNIVEIANVVAGRIAELQQ
jgi:hypothetical protein